MICNITGVVGANGSSSPIFKPLLRRYDGNTADALKAYVFLRNYHPNPDEASVEDVENYLKEYYDGAQESKHILDVSAQTEKLLSAICSTKEDLENRAGSSNVFDGQVDLLTFGENLLPSSSRAKVVQEATQHIKGKFTEKQIRGLVADYLRNNDNKITKQNLARFVNELENKASDTEMLKGFITPGDNVKELGIVTGEWDGVGASKDAQANVDFLIALTSVPAIKFGEDVSKALSEEMHPAAAELVQKQVAKLGNPLVPAKIAKSALLSGVTFFEEDALETNERFRAYRMHNPISAYGVVDAIEAEVQGHQVLDVHDIRFSKNTSSTVLDRIQGKTNMNALAVLNALKLAALQGKDGVLLPIKYLKTVNATLGTQDYPVIAHPTGTKVLLKTDGRFIESPLPLNFPTGAYNQNGIVDSKYVWLKEIYKEEGEQAFEYAMSPKFLKENGRWDIVHSLTSGQDLTTEQSRAFELIYDSDVDALMADAEETLKQLSDGKSLGSFTEVKPRTVSVSTDISLFPGIKTEVDVEALSRIIDHLKLKYPDIPVHQVYSKSKPYAGKLESGEVYINLAKATIDTPFHEFGHILARTYIENATVTPELLEEMRSTRYYQELLKESPNMPEVELAEETLVHLVGLYASQEYMTQKEKGLLRRLVDWIARTLSGRTKDLPEDFFDLSSTARKVIAKMGTTLSVGNDAELYVPTSLMQSVMYQKAPTDRVIKDLTDFVNKVTGSTEIEEKIIDKKVAKISGEPFNKDWETTRMWFMDKTQYDLFMKNRTEEDPEPEVFNVQDGVKTVEEFRAAIYQEVSKQAITKSNVRKSILDGALTRGATYKDQGKQIGRIFPEWVSQSSDPRLNSSLYYFTDSGSRALGTSKYSHLYSPELKDTDTAVAIHRYLDENGEIQEYAQLAKLTDKALMHTKAHESLYKGTEIEFKKAQGKGLAETYSTFNKEQLRLSLLSAIMKDKGMSVGRAVVASLQTGGSTLDAPKLWNARVYATLPSNVFPEIKDLLNTTWVQERVKLSEREGGTILSSLYSSPGTVKDDLLSPMSYYRSYINQVLDYYNQVKNDGSGWYDKGVIDSGIDVLKNPEKVSDYLKLERAVKTRLEVLDGTTSDIVSADSKEFILLSGLLQELQSPLHRSVNPQLDMSTVEKWMTSINGVSDPYISWWIREYKKSKTKVNEGLFKVVDRNKNSFEKLLAYYNKKHSITNATGRTINDPTKYFDNLVKKEMRSTGELDKNGDVLQEQVYTNKLITKQDAEWNNLSEAEQQYIENALEVIKEGYIEWKRVNFDRDHYSVYLQKNFKSDNDSSFEEFLYYEYEKSLAAKGYLPIARANPKEILVRGKDKDKRLKIKEAWNRQADLMAAEATYIDSDQELNSIPDYLYSRYDNVEAYNKAIGLGPTNSIDDVETFRIKQQQISKNLQEIVNEAAVQSLQVQHYTPLITMWKSAAALLHKQASEHLLDNNDTVEGVSNNLEFLDIVAQKLLFRKTQTLAGNKKLSQVMNSLMMANSFLTLGFNAVSNIANITSMMTNIAVADVGTQLAGKDDKNNLTKAQWEKEAKSFLTEGIGQKKLWEIGRRVGAIHMDASSALNVRRLTGEVVDVVNPDNAFLLDKMGDEVISLWRMYTFMKREGVWDSWEYNESTKELTYNEAKDNRPQAVKDAVRENLIKEGILELDDVNTYSPYDLNAKLRLERRKTKDMGGYTEGNQTTAGMMVLGRTVSQFRKYMFMHAENSYKKRMVNPSSIGYSLGEGGKLMLNPDVEEGYAQSLNSAYQKIRHYGINGFGKQLSLVEKENMARVMSFMSAAILAQAAYSLFLAMDDEKIDWATGKTNNFNGWIPRIYLATIGELNLINSMVSKLDVLNNPLSAMAIVNSVTDLFLDVITGDAEGAATLLSRKVGILKTASTAYSSVVSED